MTLPYANSATKGGRDDGEEAVTDRIEYRQIRYKAESNGYAVMIGDEFIGRVSRSRGSYEHSNGRTYKFWSWSAWPPEGQGSLHHRTRASAAKVLAYLATE